MLLVNERKTDEKFEKVIKEKNLLENQLAHAQKFVPIRISAQQATQASKKSLIQPVAIFIFF